jgi:SSS family solute:Na+ symporter
MALIDHLIVFSYLLGIVVTTYFAIRANKKFNTSNTSLKSAEKQFLAGRQVTTTEAVFSIVATEFSATTFVQIPVLAMMGQRGLLWGMLGIIIGRWIIAKFLLNEYYSSGITVFDSLSRGAKHYSEKTRSAMRAQRLLAVIYFFTKVLSVAGGMYLGVSFIGKFYNINFAVALFIIIILTASYTILGGLRAIMRTDILQLIAVSIGGMVLLKIGISKNENSNILQTLVMTNQVGFGTSGIIPILVGIVSGFVIDFSTHGVEQDFVQKLKACQSPEAASRAILWSTWLTIILHILFLSIGASFIIDKPILSGLDIPQMITQFMEQTIFNLGPIEKGFMVVAILSATMSTLDSSLNALSSVLWNDILTGEKAARKSIFIKFDNAVVTLFVGMFAFFVGQNPMYVKGFLTLNSIVLLPIICCFVLRFAFYKRINFSFNFSNVIFIILSCLLGIVITTFYLKLPIQLSFFLCVVISMLTISFHEKLKEWI